MLQLDVSECTIWHEFCCSLLFWYEASICSFFQTLEHKILRLNWAESYATKETSLCWQAVFSGENAFTLDGPNCNQNYWHHINDVQKIYFRCHSGGSGFLVWCFFSHFLRVLLFSSTERRTHSVTLLWISGTAPSTLRWVYISGELGVSTRYLPGACCAELLMLFRATEHISIELAWKFFQHESYRKFIWNTGQHGLQKWCALQLTVWPVKCSFGWVGKYTAPHLQYLQ